MLAPKMILKVIINIFPDLKENLIILEILKHKMLIGDA